MSKRWIGYICFTLIAVMLWQGVSRCMVISDHTDIANIEGFYQEPKNSLEVVLMGQSELYADFSSTLAWRDYGFTSYNLSVGGITCNMYESVLEEIMKKQSPKVLVVNAQGFLAGEWTLEHEVFQRKWLDNMPLSRNWWRTIQREIPKEEREKYYWNFENYHNGWKTPIELLKCNAIRARIRIEGKSYLKGFGSTIRKNNGEGLAEENTYEFSKRAELYLEKFVECARKHNVEHILFVCLPHQQRNTESGEIALERFEEKVNALSCDYLNMDKGYETIGIDDKNDFSDKEHMNAYGLEKFTKYFGAYLMENYAIGSTSEAMKPQEVNSWNQCAKITQKVVDACKQDMENGICEGGRFEYDAYELRK